MAKDLKISEFGDLAIKNGDLVLVEGAEEIAQRLRSRFRTQYREWIYDRRLGFPTVGAGGMFDGETPLVFRLAMLRKYILDTAGVTGISKFDVDSDDPSKTLIVSVTLQTEFGPVETEIEI